MQQHQPQHIAQQTAQQQLFPGEPARRQNLHGICTVQPEAPAEPDKAHMPRNQQYQPGHLPQHAVLLKKGACIRSGNARQQQQHTALRQPEQHIQHTQAVQLPPEPGCTVQHTACKCLSLSNLHGKTPPILQKVWYLSGKLYPPPESNSERKKSRENVNFSKNPLTNA